jgi:hypothetical protein
MLVAEMRIVARMATPVVNVPPETVPSPVSWFVWTTAACTAKT